MGSMTRAALFKVEMIRVCCRVGVPGNEPLADRFAGRLVSSRPLPRKPVSQPVSIVTVVLEDVRLRFAVMSVVRLIIRRE